MIRNLIFNLPSIVFAYRVIYRDKRSAELQCVHLHNGYTVLFPEHKVLNYFGVECSTKLCVSDQTPAEFTAAFDDIKEIIEKTYKNNNSPLRVYKLVKDLCVLLESLGACAWIFDDITWIYKAIEVAEVMKNVVSVCTLHGCSSAGEFMLELMYRYGTTYEHQHSDAHFNVAKLWCMGSKNNADRWHRLLDVFPLVEASGGVFVDEIISTLHAEGIMETSEVSLYNESTWNRYVMFNRQRSKRFVFITVCEPETCR